MAMRAFRMMSGRQSARTQKITPFGYKCAHINSTMGSCLVKTRVKSLQLSYHPFSTQASTLNTNGTSSSREAGVHGKTFSVGSLVDRLEEGRENPNELISHWLSETGGSRDNALHDLLHCLIMEKDKIKLSDEVLQTDVFGETVAMKILQCGRIIKLARPGTASLRGTLSQRVAVHEDAESEASMESSQSLHGNKLVSKLVHWCEEQSEQQLQERRVKPCPQSSPFKNRSDYFNICMYIYCQAGFVFDAISLWKLFIEEFQYKPNPRSVAGFVKMLCNQIVIEDVIDQQNVEDYETIGDNALIQLRRVLNLIKNTNFGKGTVVMNSICSKALQTVVYECVSIGNEEDLMGPTAETFSSDRTGMKHDTSKRRLDELIILIQEFEQAGIPIKRNIFTSLLVLCNQGYKAGSKSCLSAPEVRNMIDARVLPQQAASLRNVDKAKLPIKDTNKRLNTRQDPDEFYSMTRYEYCVYAAALEKTSEHSRGSMSKAEYLKDKIQDVCRDMSQAGLLPLKDTFLVTRATVGDIHGLQGALLIKHHTGEELNMKALTKIMRELVAYEGSMTPSDEAPEVLNPHLALAWRLWTDFRKAPNPELPDLRLFNVALTAASKMKDVPQLDELMFSLSCTPTHSFMNEHDSLEERRKSFRYVSPQVNTPLGLKLSHRLEKARQRLAASMGRDKDEVSFLQPDLFTYNIVIDAYGQCGHLYRALELYDEMRHRGIKPDVITYNSLTKAYVLENRLDDAVKLIKEANQQGVTANYITFRTLCHAFGESSAMLTELHQMEYDHVNKQSYQSSYDKMINQASTWKTTPESCHLSLDLHFLNIAEAKAKVMQELEFLHQFYREERNKSSRIKDGDDYDSDNDEDITSEIERSSILPDLILITGVGKHSLKKAKKGAMKHAMIELLNQEGVGFYEAPRNPGRLIIPSPQLKLFFEKYRIRNMHTSYSDYMSLRYMVLPSFVASILILPKVAEFYTNFS